VALVVTVTLVCSGAALAAVPRVDDVGDVDAVVVLGGGSGERAALGRQIAEARGVPLVLAGDAAVAPRADPGCGTKVGAWEVACVLPEDWNTAGEARAVTDLAAERGWARVGVVTSRFHVNRARTLFAQCLGRDAVDVAGAVDRAPPLAEVLRHARELAGRLAAVTIRRAC
jgi:uncharacterized SAM-binding protein YcdF (DUF218 family)